MGSLKINDAYKTIRNQVSAEIKIKKSIFIAQAFPVNSTDEVREKILNVKKEYFDARHHPFAYRIGYDRMVSHQVLQENLFSKQWIGFC